MQHFIEKYTRLTGKPVRGITPDALDRLDSHDWPGNVRELENAIERAVVLATGELITPADLPEFRTAEESSPAGVPFRVGQTLGELEREAIQRTLKAVSGDKDAAAKILGIGVATLYRRLKDMEEGAKDSADSPSES